jgi:hypothetical protein
MTDKDFERLLMQERNKSKYPTSGWLSKTDSKGNKEWNHYRFHDTSNETSSMFWIFIIGILITILFG